MIGLDRRTMIKGVATGSVVFSMHPVAWAAEQRPGVFVADARFQASAALALDRRNAGVAVIDSRTEDLGIAWRSRIPKLLEQNGAVEGVTLWSDLLVCQTFARLHGLKLVRPPRAVAFATTAGQRYWKLA